MKPKTLERIRRAAKKLLAEKDFDDITTRRIAAEASISEATLFRYIGSKQELLHMVYGDQLDELLTVIEHEDSKQSAGRPCAVASTFIVRILNPYRMRCEFYASNPRNAARYLRVGFDPSNPDFHRNLSQGDRSIRLTVSILDEAGERGLLIKGLDTRIIAQNIHAIYMHEIDRTPVRGLDPSTIWDRLEPRLRNQVLPIFRCS